jgi:hypothetical protein
MKKKLVMTMLAGVMSLALCTACTSGAEAPAEEAATEETVEATEEVAEEPTEETAEEPTEEAAEAEAEDEGVDEEANLEAVQASLTYMGGLYVNGNPDCDMELALFRNEDGDMIGIVYELGSIEYGMYETETGTLSDGTEYTVISFGEKKFGYYFDESLETGILVDQDGNVNEALALDESVARDLVTTTLMGESYVEKAAE